MNIWMSYNWPTVDQPPTTSSSEFTPLQYSAVMIFLVVYVETSLKIRHEFVWNKYRYYLLLKNLLLSTYTSIVHIWLVVGREGLGSGRDRLSIDWVVLIWIWFLSYVIHTSSIIICISFGISCPSSSPLLI